VGRPPGGDENLRLTFVKVFLGGAPYAKRFECSSNSLKYGWMLPLANGERSMKFYLNAGISTL
jgi:hypothetical protein